MEKKSKVKKIVKAIVAVVLVVALCFGGYTAYNFYTRMQNFSNVSEVFANSVGFTIASAEKDDVREVISTSGVVYIKEESTISSESSEKIKEALFSEGDYINAGDVVVTYDVSDTIKSLERKISDSQISLENARLSLRSLALPISESEASKLRDSVTSAEKSVYDRNATLKNTQKDITFKQAEIEKAEKSLESSKVLLDAGAITKDEYDKAEQSIEDLRQSLDKLYVTLESNERDLSSAEETLENANYDYEHAYDVLTEESQRIKYQQQENSVRSAEATLNQAKEDLADVIYEAISQYSGTVIAEYASENSSIPVGSALYTVADLTALIVKADVSEYDAPKLAVGQSVNMTSDGIPDVVYTGKITKIASSATTKSTAGGSESVVSVEIMIDNPDGVLKPGFNLDVDIIAVDRQNVLSITQAALLREPETKKNYVYTVSSENIAAKTYVETGLYGDMLVEITSGLTEGDRIVTNPSDQLSDGMFVMTGRPEMADRANAGQNMGGGGLFGGMFGGGGNNVRIQQGNSGGRSNQAIPSGGAAPGNSVSGGFNRGN